MNPLRNRLKRFAFGFLTLTALSLLSFATPGLAEDGGGGRQPAAKVTAQADKLHVILVGYTRPDKVGTACQKDILAMKHHLETVFAREKGRLVVHNLMGDRWSGAKVMDYLRALKVGQNDNVLFYHSGHGGIYSPSHPEKSQVLQLNSGNLFRGHVTDLLKGKHPRGLIILTDCCSNFPRELPILAQPNPLNAESVRNLFLRMRGLVSITAAKDGQSASSQSQGINLTGARSAFTVALFQELSKTDRVFTSWQDLSASLSDRTNLVSGGQHRPRTFSMQEKYTK
jgi:hypothetical protein